MLRRLSVALIAVTCVGCDASGRLFGLSLATGLDGLQLVNYSFPTGSSKVTAKAGPTLRCVGQPCGVSQGRGSTIAGTIVDFEAAAGAGKLATRDASDGKLITTSPVPKGATLYAVQNSCEGGCSNGESLVYEHCNYMATMTFGHSAPVELVCIMNDGTITARKSLPTHYSVDSSGPFASHARILMTDSYCVVASSATNSAIFCLNPEFDFTKNELTVTLSSFTHAEPAWGSKTPVNPIVAVIGAHPAQMNTLLVLAAHTGAVVPSDGKDMTIRRDLYIAALVGGEGPPSNTSKMQHIADLPANFAAGAAATPSFGSLGFAFLDYNPTYPNADSSVLAAVYDVEGTTPNPKLVRIPISWPEGAPEMKNEAVQSWAWDEDYPEVVLFIPDRAE